MPVLIFFCFSYEDCDVIFFNTLKKIINGYLDRIIFISIEVHVEYFHTKIKLMAIRLF